MLRMLVSDETRRDGTCEVFKGCDPDPATHRRCKGRATHEVFDDDDGCFLACRRCASQFRDVDFLRVVKLHPAKPEGE